MITATTAQNGSTCYAATCRGVFYFAAKDSIGWGVASKRLALGPQNIGGFKRYANLQELESGCKAFAGITSLVGNAGGAA